MVNYIFAGNCTFGDKKMFLISFHLIKGLISDISQLWCMIVNGYKSIKGRAF